MDATNQLKQAFALSCFQLIKWWKCISPTPRNLFHNHIPCQPLPFHSLEKLQVEKVGRKGGMNRNEKHWRCCYFSPSLELMKWQKLMSVVKQRRKKKVFLSLSLSSFADQPNSSPKGFRKVGTRKIQKPFKYSPWNPAENCYSCKHWFCSCRKELFPHTQHLPLNSHPAHADKLSEAFSSAKPGVWRVEIK